MSRAVKVYKAQPLFEGQAIPDLFLSAQDTLPDLPVPTLSAHRSTYTRLFRMQAMLILHAMEASLPGGTLDHLFALMADRRASIHTVPTKERKERKGPKTP